jgi:hypothetical protein
MRVRSPRFLLAPAGALLLSAALAPAALASHQQGGTISGVTIGADGHLTGQVSYVEQNSGNCVVGNPSALPATVTFPDSTTEAVSVPIAATNCLPSSSNYQGALDIDLPSVGGASATAGAYGVEVNTCCVIGGIVNFNGSTVFGARLTWDGATVARGPVFASLPAPGIPIGHDYSQNLNASSPSGGPLSYTSLAGQPNSPATDIITLGASTGQITIPAATTSSMMQGDAYVYRVQATDGAGNFAQRMALLKATNNAPPTIAGLQDTYYVEPGKSAEFAFSASDSAGQTVSLYAFGAPSWTTLDATSGNPAGGTLRVSPPAGLAAGTRVTVNIDAVDSDTFASLVTSRTVTFVAAAAPTAEEPPALAPAPAPAPADKVVIPLVPPKPAPTEESTKAGQLRTIHRLDLTSPGRYTFIYVNKATGKRVAQLSGSRLGKRTLTKNFTAPVLVASKARKVALISLFNKKLAKFANLQLRIVLKKPDGTLVEETLS